MRSLWVLEIHQIVLDEVIVSLRNIIADPPVVLIMVVVSVILSASSTTTIMLSIQILRMLLVRLLLHHVWRKLWHHHIRLDEIKRHQVRRHLRH